jgi:hypothetical protein
VDGFTILERRSAHPRMAVLTAYEKSQQLQEHRFFNTSYVIPISLPQSFQAFNDGINFAGIRNVHPKKFLEIEWHLVFTRF